MAGLMHPLQALFGFHGRMRRRDFWAYVALFWAGYIAAAAVSAIGLHLVTPLTPGRSLGVCLLAGLPVAVWVYLALHIKRLHDVGYPATSVLSTLRPVVGWIWGFSECGLREGTPGPNRYGASPKPVRVAEVFD